MIINFNKLALSTINFNGLGGGFIAIYKLAIII